MTLREGDQTLTRPGCRHNGPFRPAVVMGYESVLDRACGRGMDSYDTVLLTSIIPGRVQAVGVCHDQGDPIPDRCPGRASAKRCGASRSSIPSRVPGTGGHARRAGRRSTRSRPTRRDALFQVAGLAFEMDRPAGPPGGAAPRRADYDRVGLVLHRRQHCLGANRRAKGVVSTTRKRAPSSATETAGRVYASALAPAICILSHCHWIASG